MSFGCVLVVDNERSHAQYLAKLLHDRKWDSVLTFSKAAAVRSLKATRFRMILLDGYVDGENIFPHIADIRKLAPSTPIVVMAQKGHADTFPAGGEGCADLNIIKPVDGFGIRAAIDGADKYHRERRVDHHILVIEEDEELRREIRLVLAQIGYKVQAAANMEDAFFDHNLGAVNVIVTAVLIPGIGGIEGTKQVRKDWPHIHVVAISQGVNDKITASHVLAAAREAGAEAALEKPFNMLELINAVADVLKAEPELAEADEAVE